MNPFKSNMGIAAVISVVLLVALIVGVNIAASGTDEPFTSARFTHSEGDGPNYCADFAAYERDEDQIEVTITNCGDAAIRVTVKDGKKGSELAVGKEYSTLLPSGVDKFDAGIETIDGESIGGFGL